MLNPPRQNQPDSAPSLSLRFIARNNEGKISSSCHPQNEGQIQVFGGLELLLPYSSRTEVLSCTHDALEAFCGWF